MKKLLSFAPVLGLLALTSCSTIKPTNVGSWLFKVNPNVKDTSIFKDYSNREQYDFIVRLDTTTNTAIVLKRVNKKKYVMVHGDLAKAVLDSAKLTPVENEIQ